MFLQWRILARLVVCLAVAGPATAAPAKQTAPNRESFAADTCSTIASEAQRNGLPETFFARLIWKESMFDPGAVSPVGAQGIAQFMPGTAKLRGLEDPFDPPKALAASAAYLAELRQTFGNLGLAAAAYNAGEEAARGFAAGQRDLPYETQDYVASITGHSHTEWKAATQEFPVPGIGGKGSFDERCRLLVLQQTAPESVKVKRAPWKPWRVVLAGGFSEAMAIRKFRAIVAQHGTVLAGAQPMVSYKRNLSRGTKRLVQVAVGRDSRESAEALCNELQQQGTACLVARSGR